jgi:hypothetical protein
LNGDRDGRDAVAGLSSSPMRSGRASNLIDTLQVTRLGIPSPLFSNRFTEEFDR